MSGAQLGKLLGMRVDVRTHEDSPKLALRKCYTGVEFEAENVRVELPVDVDEAGFWVQKTDHSLRNNGMEFVLREPLFGADLVTAVEWLCKWATENKFEINYRTGLHVHIDCRNMTTPELISMIVYKALFEKIVFQWVGDDREGNIFCMPFYKAEGVLEQIVNMLNSGQRMMNKAAEKIDRYAAFNLNSLSRFGTVEWRHMQTTFNSERVLKWINICQGFKRYARAAPLKPESLILDMSKLGPERMFAAIVGPDLAREMWTNKSDKLVETYGLPVAQEFALLLNGSVGTAWDSVRSALGAGENPRWKKWVARQKESAEMTSLPENIFSEPELLHDPELQKEAVKRLSDGIRTKLDQVKVVI